MKRIFFALSLLTTLSVSVYALNGKISISSNTEGALVYIDGKNIAKISHEPVILSVTTGKHEIMVSNLLDEDWQEVARQNVIVDDKEVSHLVFELALEKISKRSQSKVIGKAHHFEKLDGGLVKDKVTGMIWQDDQSVTELKRNWIEAKAYCNKLVIGSYKEWRLPTYDELITIVDYTKHTLAVMPQFQYIISADYWSSTTDEENKEHAKNVYFGNGCPDSTSKSNRYYVRCVH